VQVDPRNCHRQWSEAGEFWLADDAVVWPIIGVYKKTTMYEEASDADL